MTTVNKMTSRTFYYNDPKVLGPLRQQQPDISDSDLKKRLKAQWKTLSTEDKKPYEDMLKQSQTPVQHQQQTVTKSKAEKVVSPQEKKMIAKKPKNPYIQYITDKDIVAQAKTQDPTVKGKTLNQFLSKQWNGMSIEERQPWVSLYEEEKKQLQENPVMVEKKSKRSKNKTAFQLFCLDRKVKKERRRDRSPAPSLCSRSHARPRGSIPRRTMPSLLPSSPPVPR